MPIDSDHPDVARLRRVLRDPVDVWRIRGYPPGWGRIRRFGGPPKPGQLPNITFNASFSERADPARAQKSGPGASQACSPELEGRTTHVPARFVPSDIVQKWQKVVDLIAEIMHVPAALIMRAEPPNIKVFVSSNTPGNPYEVASLNTGFYCRTVMTTGQALHVADGRLDERWKSSTDTKRGMISYLGVPINWPDGEVFGTICVYDHKRNDYSEPFLRLLMLWRDVLQADLRTLATLHSQLAGRDARIRRLVEANIIGIGMWQLEPQAPEPYDATYVEANDAFLRVVGYDRDDLATGRIRRADLTPLEWRDRAAQAHAELTMTGTFQPYEKEFIRKDGSRAPVLIGAASFEEDGSQGVAFVLDLTERKRAEAEARESERRYREALMELAHANRVAVMGQLTASIAHEVNQPITATAISAQAALRWLDRRPTDLEEVRLLLANIVNDSQRAGDVVRRIGDLVKKAPARRDRLEINGTIREAIELTHGETVKNCVSVQTDLAGGLPLIEGDRVQLQQVILNLIMNAVEAMSGVAEGPRELLISTARTESGCVLVALRDSGPGMARASLDLVFEAFHTTKPGGMGMGLSISRSIIEAHEGRIWASANEPRGAVVQFTLPPERDGTVPAEPAAQMPVL